MSAHQRMTYSKGNWIILTLFLLLTVTGLWAGFMEVLPGISAATGGCLTWGDSDNDGDLDLLLMGYPYQCRLYVNNGDSTFTNCNAALIATMMGSADWGDMDNNGEMDVLLTGISTPESCLTRLFRNNGNNSFDAIINEMPGLSTGYAVWADIDNDGDADFINAGNTINQQPLLRIWNNEGNDAWALIQELPGVGYGMVTAVDFDNDMDIDILISGMGANNVPQTLLYRNDGNYNFTLIQTPFPQVAYSRHAWGDYDNDGDTDLLICGSLSESTCTTELWRNEGDGSFVEIETSFPDVHHGSVSWADYDNDGWLDALIAGSGNSYAAYTEVYHNNQDGSFTLTPAGLVDVSTCCLAWGDWNSDHKLDVALMGNVGLGPAMTARIYYNQCDSVNTAPSVPSNLHSWTDSVYVYFGWDASEDAQTPASGLTYNLRIGTTSGGNEMLSSLSDSTGWRKVARRGWINGNTWKIKYDVLAQLPHYYWTVQAIDNSYEGSAWAPEMEMINQSTDEHIITTGVITINALYPNPAYHGSKVNIKAVLPPSQRGELSIYNIKGQEVKHYACKAGENNLVWEGGARGSGIYLCRLKSGNGTAVRKLVVLD